MSNIILLFACLVSGMAIGWSKRFPPEAHLSLNAFVMHISLPALILLQIHHLHLRSDVLYSVGMPWMLFTVTSFVGLPMIEAFYGRSGIATGILIDQLGTYLVLSTLGITIAALYSHGSARVSTVLRRIVSFPPFVALVLMQVDYPIWLTECSTRLAARLHRSPWSPSGCNYGSIGFAATSPRWRPA
jgi:malate permease and related proteins